MDPGPVAADRGTTAAAAPPPGARPAPGIGFDAVTVAYRGQVVLDSLTLDVQRGEIVALIGPSGSGKTTALRAVAGFLRPRSGRVHIDGRDVTDLPPYERGIGLVVQHYALFPHQRVRDNVAFGLRARKAPRALVEERVPACLRLVGMAEYADRFPRELSGGQQQRVAIARALAVEPRVLLLDEPLSALDAQIRRNLVEEIARLHRELPELTVLYVTHDQSEAITLADRIAVLRDGRLSSLGPSRDLYRRPPNRFTAEFLGRANLLPVRADGGPAPDGYTPVIFGETRIIVSGVPIGGPGRELLVCVRPHDLRPAGEGEQVNRLAGVVRAVHWQGDSHAVTLACSGVDIRLIAMPMRLPPQPGDALEIAFEPDDATLLPGDSTHG